MRSGTETNYDRRTFLSSLLIGAGGLALQIVAPSSAHAKTLRKSYPIVYHLNGGSNPGNQVKRIKRGKQLAVSRLKKPKRRGYCFVDWRSNRKLSKKAQRIAGRASKRTRTLYAKWKPRRYTISYALNGGKATKGMPKHFTVESPEITLRPATRKGYLFKGWYSDKKLTKRRVRIKAGSVGNLKLYAKWQAAKYSIAYALNGGMPTLDLPTSYTIASPTIAPFPPTRSGHRFVGWYSNKALTKSKPSIPSGSTGDVTLYAKWASTDYWNDHLDTKVARINKLAQKKKCGPPSLVFITDMHLPTNTLVSPDVVRKVLDRTDANMVVFGGDAINAATTKEDAVGMLRFVRNAFGNAEVHMVRGNHDANSLGSKATKATRISDADFIRITGSPNEKRPNGKLYYYRDDADNKMRYIFLDSGAPPITCIDSQQLAWLSERILELEEGWTVLMFVHQFYSSIPKDGTSTAPQNNKNGELIRGLLDGIYDQANAVIAGVVSGHIHANYAERSSKGYAIVSSVCDACNPAIRSATSSRQPGKVTEQAFDVITIDTEEQLLYFTRVGSGKNRKVPFAPIGKVTDPPEDEPAGQPDDEPQQTPPVDDGALSALQMAGLL